MGEVIRRPPDWELEMIWDVADRWGIAPDEADSYLDSIDAFGPKEDWPVDETYTDSTSYSSEGSDE